MAVADCLRRVDAEVLTAEVPSQQPFRPHNLRGVQMSSEPTVPLSAAQAHHMPDLPPSLLLSWSPVIDGVELSLPPMELAAAGQLAPGVHVLLGTNRDEGTMFVRLPTDAREDALQDYLLGQTYVQSKGRLAGRACRRPRVPPRARHPCQFFIRTLRAIRPPLAP